MGNLFAKSKTRSTVPLGTPGTFKRKASDTQECEPEIKKLKRFGLIEEDLPLCIRERPLRCRTKASRRRKNVANRKFGKTAQNTFQRQESQYFDAQECGSTFEESSVAKEMEKLHEIAMESLDGRENVTDINENLEDTEVTKYHSEMDKESEDLNLTQLSEDSDDELIHTEEIEDSAEIEEQLGNPKMTNFSTEIYDELENHAMTNYGKEEVNKNDDLYVAKLSDEENEDSKKLISNKVAKETGEDTKKMLVAKLSEDLKLNRLGKEKEEDIENSKIIIFSRENSEGIEDLDMTQSPIESDSNSDSESESEEELEDPEVKRDSSEMYEDLEDTKVKRCYSINDDNYEDPDMTRYSIETEEFMKLEREVEKSSLETDEGDEGSQDVNSPNEVDLEFENTEGSLYFTEMNDKLVDTKVITLPPALMIGKAEY